MKRCTWENPEITERHITVSLSFSRLELRITETERECHILLYGGQSPHIGSVVMSQPRLSLKGDGKISCTSSVWNQCGHKDETLCRMLAEKMAVTRNKPVVCAGGFHVDSITEEQIRELTEQIHNIEL